jgi:hypothetical protein
MNIVTHSRNRGADSARVGNLAVWIAGAILFLACTARANAGDAAAAAAAGDSANAGQTRPVLGGHAFVPYSAVDAPFITTHLRSTLGYGSAVDMKVAYKNLDGEIVKESQGDLLYTNLQLEYQQRVLQWLAINGQMLLNGRIGQDATTLLAQGITGVTGAQLTGVARVAERRNWLLSGTLGISSTNITGIRLLDFAREVVDSGKITPDNKLIRSGSATRGSVGLRFAQGLNGLFGYTLLAEEGFGDSFRDGESSASSYRLGGTVNFDFRPKYRVPVGLLAGYLVNSLAPIGGDINGNMESYLFQVAYTGRKDFSIALESSYSTVPLNQSNERLKFNATQLTMRYYF